MDLLSCESNVHYLVFAHGTVVMGTAKGQKTKGPREPKGKQSKAEAVAAPSEDDLFKQERTRKATIILCQSALLALTGYFKAPANAFFPAVGALFSTCAAMAYLPWQTGYSIACRVASGVQVRSPPTAHPRMCTMLT